AERRARTRRCAVHPVRLVASRRIADAVQRAGELLVERCAADQLGVRQPAARGARAARPAAGAARGVAHVVRAIRVQAGRRDAGAPAGRAAWVVGTTVTRTHAGDTIDPGESLQVMGTGPDTRW